MGIRYRNVINLAPGIRMNLSASGVSWSIGPRGLSFTVGSRGMALNAGVPGTGLSFRKALMSNTEASNGSVEASEGPSVLLIYDADGRLRVTDEERNPLPESVLNHVKKKHRPEITSLMERACEQINTEFQSVVRLHHLTTRPGLPVIFDQPLFSQPRPPIPPEKTPSFLDRMIPGRKKVIATANAEAMARYDAEFERWAAEKRQFEQAVDVRTLLVHAALEGEPQAVETIFGEILSAMQWPRQTTVSFEVARNGSHMALDVDLPEIEDMPDRAATIPQRGVNLSVKRLTDKERRQVYIYHVHAIAFRLLGEVFSRLPSIKTVSVAGYSQIPDPSTGHISDRYLISVQAQRALWEQINFDNLDQVSVTEALQRMEIRCVVADDFSLREVIPLERKEEPSLLNKERLA